VLQLEQELENRIQEYEALEKNALKYKTLLDEKYKDCEQLKKDYEGIFRELVIAKERQNQTNEANKVRYYKKKLEERNVELNSLRKKRMTDTQMRKSYGDFDDLFKKVR
jgi:hypothetical protein